MNLRVRLKDECPVYEESQRAYSCNKTLFYAPIGANVAEAYSTSLRVTMTEILDRHPSPGRDRSEDLYFGVLSYPSAVFLRNLNPGWRSGRVVLQNEGNSKKSLDFHRGICIGKTTDLGDYFVKSDKQELYQGNFVDNHPKNLGDEPQYRFLTAWVFAI